MEVGFYRSLPHSKYMGFGTHRLWLGSSTAHPPLLGPRGFLGPAPSTRPFGAVPCKSVFTDHCPIANTWGWVHLEPPVARLQHRAPPTTVGPLGSSWGQPLLLQAIWCSSVEVFFYHHCPIANTWGSVHLEPPVARLQHPAPPPLLGPRGLPRASPFYCRPFGAVRWNSLPIIAP